MRGEFSGGSAATEGTKTSARARCSNGSSLWKLEPHVCRSCFSRIASTRFDDDHREYVCTNCDMTAVGTKASCLCACGLTAPAFSSKGTTSGRRDLGLRCHENKARSPDFPALYVASYGGVQSEG